MAYLFSPANRFFTWRKLWLNLAKAEKQLGLPISDEAINQMEANLVRVMRSEVDEASLNISDVVYATTLGSERT